MIAQTVVSVRRPASVGGVLTAAAAALVAANAWGSCFPPPAGLVGWWPGEGNANDIQGTNNGILQGGATASAIGVVGQTLGFDGTNSFVQIPNNAALQPANLTIEAWVRFNSLDSAGSGGAPAGDQYIVFKQNAQTWNFEGFDLSKTRVTGGDVFRFLVTSASAQSVEIHSATMVTTGVWYHVAAVRGSNYTQIYVNGNLERQTNVTFAQSYGSLPLYFGTSGQSYWDRKFKGLLDEVSLYNRALSSNEVAAIYAAGAAGKCKAVNGLSITTQPQSQSVAMGNNARFTVAAAGAAPLSYQWQFNGEAMAGATDTNLALANVQPADGGSYTVVVTNAAASVTSAVAVLTVVVPPTITTEPASQSVNQGASVTFSVAASGTAPFSYQWQFNHAGISGATASSYTRASVQSGDAGSYSVVVSNLAGSATSLDATLAVSVPSTPPTITGQPQNQTISQGGSATFTVVANGTAPLNYQWAFYGTNLSGATGSSFTRANAQPADAGPYSVVVSNAVGTAASSSALLTVVVPGSCAPPPSGLVGWWPGDGTASDLAGSDNGALQGGATATAAGMVAQAFSLNGTNSYVQIPDSSALRPTNLTIEAWVRFSSLNSAGSGGSPAGDQYIVFKQNSQTWSFEGYDLSKTRVTGGDVFRFLVTSASAQSVGIQSSTLVATGVWYHVAATRGSNFTQLYVNGHLESQTNVSFPQNYGTLPLYFGTSGQSYWDHKLNGTLDEVSLYNRALSSNEVAAIYASGAAGKCKAPSGPTITAQPQNQTVAGGSSATFTVTAGGTAPLSYQWQYNGANLSGATSASLTLANVQPANAGSYTVVVTNAVASVTSAVAVLTVLTPPAITAQPQSLSVAAGTTASFSAMASGSAPLSYQWRLNGVNLANGGRISGAASTTLTISGVQPADAGNYTLVASNGAGSATSAAATLTVTGPPAIVTQPASQSVVAGGSASFSVTASGTAPLGYQWRFSGANLSGATGTSLTLANVQLANAGSYTAVVTNSFGSVTSAVAVLTVSPGAGTVIINGAQTYQTIDGFGVNANAGSWNNNNMKPVIDALIDQAGMTLFLAEFVGNCNWEAANANPGASLTNWTYFDNVYTGPNFQQLWGMMAYLNQRGITTGVIPKFTGPTALWMGGESLTPGYENAYAEMIASAVIYARKNQNLQFTEVSPLNEPDNTYVGVHLSGASQYVTVVDDLGRQLDANGMSDIRFSGPDLAYTTTSWMTAMMGDPYLMSKVDHFGLHGYQGLSSDATGVASLIQQSAYPNTHFWMTEFGVWCSACQSGTSGDNSWAYALGNASYLLTLLAEGASAGLVFEAWDGEWINYDASTGQDTAPTWDFWGLFAVTNINASPLTYTPRKSFYTLAQIAKFVRPGAQRIGVGGASTPLTLLAFYNPTNGQFTLTGVNSTSSATSLSCALESLPAIPSLNLYYTSSSVNLAQGAQVTVNNGAFSVMVPANCVFTLTYSNAVAGQAVPPVISQLPQFLAPLVQNGNLTLTLVGASGSACRIEASSNLVDWFAVETQTLSGGKATISQPMTPGPRFFRARLLP